MRSANEVQPSTAVVIPFYRVDGGGAFYIGDQYDDNGQNTNTVVDLLDSVVRENYASQTGVLISLWCICDPFSHLTRGASRGRIFRQPLKWSHRGWNPVGGEVGGRVWRTVLI